MGMKPRTPAIELDIEELGLTGFSARDGHAIRDAVEQELGRLLTLHGPGALTGAETSIDRVRTRPLRFEAGARPHTIGAGIARAVFHELRGPAASKGLK